MSEGTEEFAEYYAQAFFNNLIADQKTPTDVKEALQNAKIGGLVGGVFGGARVYGPKLTPRPLRTSQVNEQTAQVSPEPQPLQPLALPAATDFFVSPSGQTKTNLKQNLRTPNFQSQYFMENPFNLTPRPLNPVYSPVQYRQVLTPVPLQNQASTAQHYSGTELPKLTPRPLQPVSAPTEAASSTLKPFSH